MKNSAGLPVPLFYSCYILKSSVIYYWTRLTATWNLFVNPLHPNISMHILHTVLYTFPKRLTRRICFTINSCFSWWSSLLFSWLSCLIQGWYCKEKLDASHTYELKGLLANFHNGVFLILEMQWWGYSFFLFFSLWFWFSGQEKLLRKNWQDLQKKRLVKQWNNHSL